jgi:hypothetical protein
MVSFAISMASSVEKVVKATTGPKISSWKTRILLFSKWLVECNILAYHLRDFLLNHLIVLLPSSLPMLMYPKIFPFGL